MSINITTDINGDDISSKNVTDSGLLIEFFHRPYEIDIFNPDSVKKLTVTWNSSSITALQGDVVLPEERRSFLFDAGVRNMRLITESGETINTVIISARG